MVSRKSGFGKKKIEIRKIEKQQYLQATFSKRRAGLFKKANDLTVLCGSEVAVLVFSPAGKIFSFGHPDADSVINRFQTISSSIDQLSESSSPSSQKDFVVKVEELSRQLRELNSLIEEEKRKQMMLNQIKSNHGTANNLDELGLKGLMGYRKMLMEKKNQLAMIAKHHSPILEDLTLNDDVSFDQLGTMDLMACAKILMSDSESTSYMQADPYYCLQEFFC